MKSKKNFQFVNFYQIRIRWVFSCWIKLNRKFSLFRNAIWRRETNYNLNKLKWTIFAIETKMNYRLRLLIFSSKVYLHSFNFWIRNHNSKILNNRLRMNSLYDVRNCYHIRIFRFRENIRRFEIYSHDKCIISTSWNWIKIFDCRQDTNHRSFNEKRHF